MNKFIELLGNLLFRKRITAEKPMMVPPIGAKIHLHSRKGVYTVIGAVGSYLIVRSRKTNGFTVKQTDFKRLAGGIYNMHLK